MSNFTIASFNSIECGKNTAPIKNGSPYFYTIGVPTVLSCKSENSSFTNLNEMLVFPTNTSPKSTNLFTYTFFCWVGSWFEFRGISLVRVFSDIFWILRRFQFFFFWVYKDFFFFGNSIDIWASKNNNKKKLEIFFFSS